MKSRRVGRACGQCRVLGTWTVRREPPARGEVHLRAYKGIDCAIAKNSTAGRRECASRLCTSGSWAVRGDDEGPCVCNPGWAGADCAKLLTPSRAPATASAPTQLPAASAVRTAPRPSAPTPAQPRSVHPRRLPVQPWMGRPRLLQVNEEAQRQTLDLR